MPAGVGQQQGVEALLAAAQRQQMSREETAALLAASYVESGWNPGAIGDGGNSFGLLQANVNGAAVKASNPRSFLNASVAANEAAARFKADGVRNGSTAVASQRPLESLRPKYAAEVDSIMSRILAGTFGPLNRLMGGGKAKAKWSPLRDQTRQKASELGLRHTSGDRSPSSNSAAGGVENSNHLSTRTDTWADDYVGSAQAMAHLVAWAKQNGAIEAMVHNAGSGLHAHIAGRASTGVDIGGKPSAGGGGAGTATTNIGWDPREWGDDIGRVAIKSVVVLAGLGLAAGLVYAGVTRLTSTQGVAKELGMLATTRGASKG